MGDNLISTATADTLELIMLNQHALRAAVEELSLWVSQRGSTDVHDSVLTILAALDVTTEGISSGIESLRDSRVD